MPAHPREPTRSTRNIRPTIATNAGDAGEHERDGSGSASREPFDEAELVDAVAEHADREQRDHVAVATGRSCDQSQPITSSATTAMTMRTALYASGGTVRVPYFATV